MHRPFSLALAAAAALVLAHPAHAEDRPNAAAEAESGAWADVSYNLFGEQPLLESGLVTIEAPYRAQDAALVPMTVATNLKPGDQRRVEKLTLVVDENPAPVAAEFELGPNANVSEISTRVRVDAYTPVHAVAELSDGSLHVAETYVKASGGCSAPVGKDPEVALARMGQMKLKRFGTTPVGANEAQLMIRHPNNSGLQMDQVTRHYIPAHFITDLTVSQGDELIFRMQGGISISEDPSFRFDYAPDGQPIVVRAVDTEGNAFEQTWQVTETAQES